MSKAIGYFLMVFGMLVFFIGLSLGFNIITMAIGGIIGYVGERHNKKLKEKTKVEGMKTEGKHLEILKTRYAKGDITKKEFEKMKRDLS